MAAFLRCASEIPASEYAAPFGLLLLSRYRLTDIETVDYHAAEPVILPRGYISAKVASKQLHMNLSDLVLCHTSAMPLITMQVPSLSQSVMCTHLTAEQDDIDYGKLNQAELTSEVYISLNRGLHTLFYGAHDQMHESKLYIADDLVCEESILS